MALIDSWESFIRIHGGEPGARDVFEKAIGELLRVENPNKEVHIVKASPGDGGIDVYIDQGKEGIDIYQCKFYMGKMNSPRWSEIKKSFKTAMETAEQEGVSVRRWFLCMPREDQLEDIKRKRKFKEEMADCLVPIAFIDGNQIIQRMRDCDRRFNTDMINRYFTIHNNSNVPTVKISQKEQIKIIRDKLCAHIESINRYKHYRDEDYVSLEVQVERNINGKQKRKSADLLSFLKQSIQISSYDMWGWKKRNKTVYLLLGKPGSGKSVALRKVCANILNTPNLSGIIPVYINLGKWSGKWTAVNPPKKKDLVKFIKNEMMGAMQQDTDAGKCLNDIFKEMLKDGRWFFVLDSFDEIPCLMGKGNNRELVRKISELIHDFLSEGKQHGGIVASRDNNDKEPSGFLEATVKLELKEFDDYRIKTMINKYLKNASDVVDKLFREQEDLVALCRNPYYLSLLIDYFKEQGIKFPKNQMELYDHFIFNRLNECDGMLKEFNLKKDDVKVASKKLSLFMLQSPEYGVECPVRTFCAQFDEKEKWNNCLSILRQIEVCHISKHTGIVSFVHRRLYDYFIADSINDGSFVPDYVDIVCNNSEPRDALALYCEVAGENAKEIASYCWRTLKENMSFKNSIDEKGNTVLINTLHFMADAFRNNRKATEDFCDEYEEMIKTNLDNNTHYMVQVAMVKGMALFNRERNSITQLVLQTFELGNNNLNDIVMENCRLIKNVDYNTPYRKGIEMQFAKYFHRKSIQTFVKQFRNTDFALSKAQGFNYVRWIHFFHFINILLIILYLVYFPTASIILEKHGFPITKYMENLKLPILPGSSALNWEKGSLSSLLVDSHTIELLHLSLTVFIITWDKRKPEKAYAPVKSSTIYQLFTGYLFMTPADNILLTVIKTENPSADPKFSNLYLTIAVAIQVAIIAINLPWIIHDTYYYYKYNESKRYDWNEYFIQSIPSVLFIVLSIIALCFAYYIPNILISALEMLFLLLGIFIVGLSVIAFPIYYQKLMYLDHISTLGKIQKEVLVSNMEKIQVPNLQLAYLNKLIDKRTRLEGNWPDKLIDEDGHRKKYENDEIEIAISILEYESIMSEKQSKSSMI